MALILKMREAPLAPLVKPGFNWDQWYLKNKARLSEKRAKRYREDPGYRAAALQRSRAQRALKKEPTTDVHTVSFHEAAQALDITVWVLREWRRKDYFPEPVRRDGRLWFSSAQVEALRQLRDFFRAQGARVTEATRGALENVTGLIYANW
jgi:hypothetical protein